jgi:hypothetical protein
MVCELKYRHYIYFYINRDLPPDELSRDPVPALARVKLAEIKRLSFC